MDGISGLNCPIWMPKRRADTFFLTYEKVKFTKTLFDLQKHIKNTRENAYLFLELFNLIKDLKVLPCVFHLLWRGAFTTKRPLTVAASIVSIPIEHRRHEAQPTRAAQGQQKRREV